MVPVKMYSTTWCGYCAAARRLLKAKGIDWEEIDVESHPDAARAMRAETHTTTVPQIFVGGTHVGGYEELAKLESQGELDQLLARAS